MWRTNIGLLRGKREGGREGGRCGQTRFGPEQSEGDWRGHNMISATAQLSLLLLAQSSFSRLGQQPLSAEDVSLIRGSDQSKLLHAVNDGSICVLLKRPGDGDGNTEYIN